MSYSIIFETKFIKLKDGRLLHLDRSGCNNDTSGRSLDDFTGKIYTVEELDKYIAERLNIDSDEWALKIGSKHCSWKEYGKHIARMAKRAENFDEFISKRHFRSTRLDGIQLYKPVEKMLSLEEFDDLYYKYAYSGNPLSYKRVFTTLKTEEEIIAAIDLKQPMEFYVKTKK